jgi:hypothetical protein
MALRAVNFNIPIKIYKMHVFSIEVHYFTRGAWDKISFYDRN